MTELSALDTARALATPVNETGGKFMLHPDTLGAGPAAGYENGFLLYAVGRGGVLGDVDADVVAAAFGYFNPGIVRAMWEQGVQVEGARAAADRYTELCARWGRARLQGMEGVERLAELIGAVVRSVEPCGLPLFAGWRAQPLADDAPARAYQLLHVLRELRGSVHVVATTATGLTPLESILAREGGGPDQARMFGWPEPYPDVADKVELRAEAEALTDTMMARHVAVLSEAERGELVELVLRAQAAIDAG